MAATSTGTGATVRLEWVPGALAQCRNAPAAMNMVNQLGQQYLAKANATLGGVPGYKLAYHMVARKYIANVYTFTPHAQRHNAANQTLAKIL
jgi:hypothetical protein